MADERVDVDGLEASLQDLIKAADATDLAKAYGGTSVEYSGRHDEDGKGGGGGAEASDIGGLDDMMIGKLTEAGIPADVIAEFGAFMSAKQEEGEEEEEEEEEGEEEEPAAKMGGKVPHDRPVPGMGKSMDALRQDADIGDAVDVSPFLEALTARMAEQLDNVRKSHASFQSNQAGVNRAQAAALYQMGTLMKSQTEVISELGRRLGIVERVPAPQRGATTTPMARALAKSMPGEAGVGGEALSKSELVSTLTYMNLEKSIRDINGRKTGELAMLADSGSIDEETVAAARHFLMTHPNEAQVAKQYR